MNGYLPPLNGLVLLDKPKGISSHATLMAAKRRLKQEKAGHGGTLDLLASGLLPVFFGSWTKLSSYCLNDTKQYRAIVRLGIQTDSGDAEGQVIKTLPVPQFDNKKLALLADAMIGKMEQTPPSFSAIKVNGVPNYKHAAQARRNKTQMRELPPRWVDIKKLHMQVLDARHIEISVTTSKGAYVRAFGEQIAERLKTCGHLVALRRVAVGGLKISEAVKIKDLKASGTGWIEIERLLPDAPCLNISHEEQDMLTKGRCIPITRENLVSKTEDNLASCATILALSPEGELVALGKALDHQQVQPVKEVPQGALGWLQPTRVLVPGQLQICAADRVSDTRIFTEKTDAQH